MNRVLIIALLLCLTACDSQGLLGSLTEPSPKVTGANYIALNGEPVPPGVPLDYTPPSSTEPTTPTPSLADVASMMRDSLPPDSQAFFDDQAAVQADYQRVRSAGFLEPVVTLDDGYPVFRAQCVFSPTRSDCTLGNGEVVDEAYLSHHLPLVRNADVLRTDWSCGTICVNEDGFVVGKVSPAMLVWRDTHCSWVTYGQPSCP